MVKRNWVFKRNCSISPRQLAMVYALISLTSLLVAIVSTLRGAWFVLGFSVVELVAVGWAFLHYARHASDREQIAFVNHLLSVELMRAGRARRGGGEARSARGEGAARD